MPVICRITIAEPCSIRVSEISRQHKTHRSVWRATILRPKKPDLDSFGSSSFGALLNAVTDSLRRK